MPHRRARCAFSRGRSRSRRSPPCRTGRRSDSAGGGCCTRSRRRRPGADRAGMVGADAGALTRDYFCVEDRRAAASGSSAKAFMPRTGEPALVRAWLVRVTGHRVSFGLRRARRRHQFLLPAGASHPEELVALARPDSAWPASASPTANSPAWCAPVAGREGGQLTGRSPAPARLRRRHARDLAYPQDRAAWAGSPAADARQSRAEKGDCISTWPTSSTMPRAWSPLVVPGPATSRTRGRPATLAHAFARPRLSRAPPRAAPATDAAPVACSPASHAPRVRRCSPPTTCSITSRRAGRCRTCSPASAST